MGSRWTTEESDILREYYPTLYGGVAQFLPHRTREAIKTQVRYLGLTKSGKRKQRSYSPRAPKLKRGPIFENGWLDEIRARRLAGETQKDIAADYGLSHTAIQNVTKDIPNITAIRNRRDLCIARKTSSDRHAAATVDRFWSRVAKSSAPDGCWEWTACKHPINGYGRMNIGYIRSSPSAEYTHRISYYLSRRRWPKKGTHVAHHCDNACCVRPDHLYEATPKENHYDSVVRNGKRPFTRKITNEDVKDIIERYQSIDDVAELSEEYGVTPTYIYLLGTRNHPRATTVYENGG